MRLLLTHLFALFTIASLTQPAAATTQVGFIDGLWFNTDSFIVDEPVRIYAAVRNHSGTDITGTVTFFVDDTAIKRQDIAALDNRVIEAWADWSPTLGSHTISAAFTNITLDTPSGSTATNSSLAELATTVAVTAPPPAPTTETAPATNASSSQASSTAQGLESYLFPSRARDLLTAITDWSSSTQQTLTDLQAKRQESEPVTTNTSSTSTTTATATTSSEQERTIVSDWLAIAKKIVSGTINTALAAAIAILGNPLIVQLVLLGGILYGIYRSARFFGRR